MKLKDPRQKRNGKLAQRQGSLRRRIKDGILHSKPNGMVALWRQALAKRRKLENAAQSQGGPFVARDGIITYLRMEEDEAIEVFAGIPTIFALMEDLDAGYRRPAWADHRYGNR